MTTMPTHPAQRLVTVLLALAMTGCASLFDPSTDDVVDPSKLQNAAGVATLLAGARRDFAQAYVGAGDDSEAGIILVSGLLADEYDNSDAFQSRKAVDQRGMDARNSSILGVYRLLHRARAAADQAAIVARRFTPDDRNTIGELHTLSGMTILSFADDFCSGVPLGSTDGSSLVNGTPQTTAQLYASAIAKFDSALALAPSARVADAARVGKGRALLGLGLFTDAATAVAGVTADFLLTTVHSDVNPTISNGIWFFVNVLNRWTVSAGTGGGIDFARANDRRVPVEDTGDTGFDGSTHAYHQLMFPSPSSPVPIVSGIEAQLIAAEAALNGADPGGMATILNGLRDARGLAPLGDPGSHMGRVDQLFRERAFWLFSTDRRLGDLRRLIRRYGRDAETVFPSGQFFKGGSYGTDVNIPIPIEERNNPNVGPQGPECLNRDA